MDNLLKSCKIHTSVNLILLWLNQGKALLKYMQLLVEPLGFSKRPNPHVNVSMFSLLPMFVFPLNSLFISLGQKVKCETDGFREMAG